MKYYNILIEYNSLPQTFTYHSEQDIQPGVRVKVPFRNRLLAGLVMEETVKPEGFETLPVDSVVDERPVLTPELKKLAEVLARKNISSVMSMVKTMLPSALKPHSGMKNIVKKTVLIKSGETAGLNQEQLESLDLLKDGIELKKAKEILSVSRINTLVKKGALLKQKREVNSLFLLQEQTDWPELSKEQEEAVKNINDSQKQVQLLYGVTGSGKTEVFIHLIRQALEKGKQALLMVPEIGLTPQMIRRISSRFEEASVIYHGSLSTSQMQEIHRRCADGTIRIVIGTRSSVFLPFQDLGIIIMDEEHDPSYQSSSTPAYHARDAAVFRAEWHGCKLILASATPSLESFARAHKGVYELTRLDHKFHNPENFTRILDMKLQRSYMGLSLDLLKAIELKLLKREKVLLLLNRRGYLPVLQCANCRQAMVCEDCGIPLSYHKSEKALICHICGKHYPIPHRCPHCGENHWSKTGIGTQRLEETLKEIFPTAKIVRMDRDSVSRKGAHQKVLEEFEESGDILLGTQMISKGHDFPDVTLVGILSVDQALARPDFRASESVYQLIEQAAGRAGRFLKKGEVYLQTYNPEHYIVELVRSGNYDKFFRREMKYRHALMYPPYQYMGMILFMDESQEKAWELGEYASEFLKKLGIHAFGPVEVSMRKKQKRVRVLVKNNDEEKLVEALWALKNDLKGKLKKSQVFFHVNPMRLEE